MVESKHQDIDGKAKQETGSLALKLNRLELVLSELVKTVNSALYQKEKRLNDVERENADLRGRVGKLEQKIDECYFFKPRMGN